MSLVVLDVALSLRVNLQQVHNISQMIKHNTLSFKANIIKLKIVYSLALEGCVGMCSAWPTYEKIEQSHKPPVLLTECSTLKAKTFTVFIAACCMCSAKSCSTLDHANKTIQDQSEGFMLFFCGDSNANMFF